MPRPIKFRRVWRKFAKDGAKIMISNKGWISTSYIKSYIPNTVEIKA